MQPAMSYAASNVTCSQQCHVRQQCHMQQRRHVQQQCHMQPAMSHAASNWWAAAAATSLSLSLQTRLAKTTPSHNAEIV